MEQKPTIQFVKSQPLLTVSFYMEYQKVKYFNNINLENIK